MLINTAEKGDLLPLGESSVAKQQAPRRRLSPYLVGLVTLLALVHLVCPPSVYDCISSHRGVTTTKPKIGELEPTKCWDVSIPKPFQCYYFHVPLDHLNESDTRTARLAVATYPAGGGNTSQDDILGTMLLNPGGPGGSGVGFLTSKSARVNGSRTGEAMDKQFRGRYNLLSWDPRGVGHSTPRANCLRWPNQGSDCGGGLARASSAAPGCNIQSSRLTSKLCAENATLAEELQYVSTASTARDMRLLYRAAGDSILHYWGFSYGTVLGSVFSAMFPDEVGRVVLDGVVDVPNYMAGLWSDNLLSTQGAYEVGLLGECKKAGDKCALNAAAQGKDLKELMDDFYIQLRDEPMISTLTNTTFLTYSDLKGYIFDALYSVYSWPKLLNATAEAVQGNATAAIQLMEGGGGGSAEPSPQAFIAIAGGDAIAKDASWTLKDYNNFVQIQQRDSETFGEIIVDNHSEVQEWAIEGKERYFGNYSVATRNPILFVTNDYDPVTPIPDARKMATLFPKASLLRNKAYGHCSTSQPSSCALGAIADYFVNGTIPKRVMGQDGLVEAGKVCQVDYEPWDDAVVKTSSSHVEIDHSAIIAESLMNSWSQQAGRRRNRRHGSL